MLTKKLGLTAVFICVTASSVFAGPVSDVLTNFSTGDVLVCFRKSGGANDVVVDAGPVLTFVNGTVNQRFVITNYNARLIGQAGLGTNSMLWSAFAWYDGTVSPSSLQWNLFLTRQRSTPYRQSQKWLPQNANYQQLAPGFMQLIPPGAAQYYPLSPNTNTPWSVMEVDDTSLSSSPYTQGESYANVIGANGDFNGDWAGTIENGTSGTFTSSGLINRSDFYQCSPTDTGTGLVTLLGYFELNTNAVMTYVAYPANPTVTTVAATGVNTTNSTLNATVNPQNDNATLFFQYGLTSSYGSVSVTNFIGTTSGSYALSISNLTAATTYHYRAAAYNRNGTNFGGDLTFTTTGGGALVQPLITNFGITNGTPWVTFTTGASGSYTLRGTNTLLGVGAPTNWPSITSIGGNGATRILSDSTPNPTNKFYSITAQ